jgi:DNA-binding MarR family transcriptional regulator
MNTEKNPSQKMVFVHADLDLYGLSPYEFRLYAHIARRGKCYSSLKKMAKICRMSVRKAQYALKTLENQNLIKKRIRKGK